MSRIILKLSGEALAGENDGTMRNAKGAVKLYDEEVIAGIAAQVKELHDAGHQIGVVTGGGNIWRGRTGDEIDRVKSDQIGMLATVMNCMYVSEIFRGAGLDTRVMTSFASTSRCRTSISPMYGAKAISLPTPRPNNRISSS